ncbi:MAG: DUF1926 domain-containing protein [Thermoleophilia bacterium]
MTAPARSDHDPPRSDADPRTPDADPRRSLYLALGVHNHQPAGNFGWVFAEHYERAYRPFLEVVESHPAIPWSLHITGPLLLWLAENHPEYIQTVRRLAAVGRLELKGGGFYEPILAAIPDEDKHEQLRRLTCHLTELFDVTPTGAWLAERVWEPHLARPLADAGLQYAVLDDSHFFAAGVSPEGTFGYHVTEEEGRRFDLFPINKDLRYLIPFRDPMETVDFLREVHARHERRREAGRLPPDAPPPLVVYDDDGEKFGGWPDTHEHVYGTGWLQRFLAALEHETAAGWLRVVTLGEFRRRFPPVGRVYLPTASYAEMLEWSGGFYRNFLVRYDEANLLHKRMLDTGTRVRRRLAALETADGGEGAAGALQAALTARDRVLRAQCNDTYWHGIFGGLYLPHLRHAAYADLIEAERLLGPEARPALEIGDLDLDGHQEVTLRSADLTVLVAPARGGVLLALDHLPTCFALLDTLRRRREPEHLALESLAAERSAGRQETAGPERVPGEEDRDDVSRSIHERVCMKEPGLERLLFVDSLPRHAFLDRFFAPETRLEELQESRARDLGDFAAAPYAWVANPAAGVELRRAGTVAGRAVALTKIVQLPRDRPGALSVRYRLVVGRPAPGVAGNEGPTPTVLFAPELTLTLLAGWSSTHTVRVNGRRVQQDRLADAATHPGAASVTLKDENRPLTVHVTWRAPIPATLHRYGVITVSRSENGFERVYQGTALVPCWPLDLEIGAALQIDFNLEVTSA